MWQPWNPVAAPGLVNTANAQGPQIVTERALEATSGIAPIAGGRKELPAVSSSFLFLSIQVNSSFSPSSIRSFPVLVFNFKIDQI